MAQAMTSPLTGEVEDILNQLSEKIASLPADYRAGLQADVERLAGLLQQQNRRWRTLADQANLLDNAHDAIIATGADFRITTWNKAAGELYGYTAEEALGQVTGQLLRSETSAEERARDYQQLQAEGVLVGEMAQWTKDNRRLIIEYRTVPVHDAAGQISGYITANRDVTERQQAEATLRAYAEATRRSEQIYRAIGESIDYGVWVCDAQGRNLYVSEALLRLLGITQQQVSDFGWANLLHPEDVERTLAAWKEFIQTGGVWDIEHRYLGQDGQYHPILARGVPVCDEQNQIVGWAGINLDISRQKETERALRESQETFQAIFQHAPFAIVLSRAADGVVADVNQTFTDLMGFERDEVIGKTALELGLVPDPAARQRLIDEIHQQGFARNTELTYLTKSGRPLILSVNSQRLLIGGVEYILGAVENITERRQAEEALEKSNEALMFSEGRLFANNMTLRARASELEALMDAVPAMIWVSRDPACREMIGNRAGYEFLRVGPTANLSSTAPAEALAQQTYHSMKDGKIIPVDELPMQIAAAKGIPARNYTYDVVFDDGATFHLIGNVNPLFDPDGKPAGAVGAFVDITAMRRLEAEQIQAQTEIEVQRRLMEQREQERQQIARDIHDGPIQTLVSTIFNLQVTKEALADRKMQIELNQIGLSIKSAVQELRQVVNELRPPSILLLGFSRTIQIYAEDFRERHPELELYLALGEGPRKFSDQTSLTLFRIYQEALNNIIRHAEATRVDVRLTHSGDHATLEIKDNGKGFAPVPDLVRQTEKGHYGMAGMKERAEALNGVLEIKSEPGKGTRVRVTFPLEEEDQGADAGE